MKSRIGNAAKRSIRGLPESWRVPVLDAILELETDPTPETSVELLDHRSYRRLRVGPYRILYRLGKGVLYIFRVEKRSGKTYRGFNTESPSLTFV